MAAAQGVVGWLVGVALLWSSGRWTWREKLLGTLVVPGGPGGILVFGLTAGGHIGSGSIRTTSDGTVTSQADSCSGFFLPPAVGIALLLASLVGPFVVAVILYGRARSRAAAGSLLSSDRARLPRRARPLWPPSTLGSS